MSAPSNCIFAQRAPDCRLQIASSPLSVARCRKATVHRLWTMDSQWFSVLGSRFSVLRLAVAVEPFQCPLHMVGAVARLAAAVQLVALARVTHELDHRLAPPQDREELLGLADRHAVVRLAMQDAQRRGY